MLTTYAAVSKKPMGLPLKRNKEHSITIFEGQDKALWMLDPTTTQIIIKMKYYPPLVYLQDSNKINKYSFFLFMKNLMLLVLVRMLLFQYFIHNRALTMALLFWFIHLLSRTTFLVVIQAWSSCSNSIFTTVSKYSMQGITSYQQSPQLSWCCCKQLNKMKTGLEGWSKSRGSHLVDPENWTRSLNINGLEDHLQVFQMNHLVHSTMISREHNITCV